MILRTGLLILASIRPLYSLNTYHTQFSPRFNFFLDNLIFSRSLRAKSFSRRLSTDSMYDFAVIGGGPGGLAAAKEAAKHGAKVILFDHVQPSPRGTTWGLGGVCVNVGCVPKKLFHYASLLGVARADAKKFGFQIDKVDSPIAWATLRGKLIFNTDLVLNYIKMLNFSYRSSLMVNEVKYVNKRASFKSPNEIVYVEKDGSNVVTTAKHVLIAIGDRPHIPPEIDKNLVITSDDLFQLDRPPGKTLVVGASYIALECGGFLTGLGFEVTIAVRSIVLRGFDRQSSEKVANLMEQTGTRFKYGVVPMSVVKDNDRLKVTFSDNTVDFFDTVLYAVGRTPDVSNMNLEQIGVNFSKSGRILTENDETSAPNVFAVGDIVENGPKLAPVAIKAGETLARRLFAKNSQNVLMDYSYIPTTIFTPYEYSTCGLSEEDAVEKYGSENISVYLSEFTSLELSLAHRRKADHLITDEYDTDLPPSCLSKLIVEKKSDRVIGAHFVGPNAGEIMQGIALAMKLGATKKDFDSTVGIHPTDAESFVNLGVTKESGQSWVSSGGCGGGKCG